PEEVPDFNGLIDIDADDALDAARGELEAGYSILGAPGFAVASLTASLEAMKAGLLENLAPIVAVTEEAAKFSAELEIMGATASELVRTPGDVLDALQGAIGTLVETAIATPLSVLHALSAAADIDFGPEPAGDTATRVRERENRRL